MFENRVTTGIGRGAREREQRDYFVRLSRWRSSPINSGWTILPSPNLHLGLRLGKIVPAWIGTPPLPHLLKTNHLASSIRGSELWMGWHCPLLPNTICPSS